MERECKISSLTPPQLVVAAKITDGLDFQQFIQWKRAANGQLGRHFYILPVTSGFFASQLFALQHQ